MGKNVFLSVVVIVITLVTTLTSCQAETTTSAEQVSTPSPEEPAVTTTEEPISTPSTTVRPPPRPPRPPRESPSQAPNPALSQPPATTTEEPAFVYTPTVAFMRYTEDSWDEYIFLVEIDGTGLKKLTPDDNVRENFPQFSPDGQQIAFSRWPKDGTPNIWVMNSDGTGRAALTELDFADMPAWSPDGQHIAFVSSHDNQFEISVMDSNGLNIRRVTNAPSMDMLPVWSPDGTRIAFLSDRFGSYRWWVINADGSGVKMLADIAVYEKGVNVPPVLLRGTWGKDNFLSGEYFIAPKITRNEQTVIQIDVEKGTKGNLTFVGIQNMIEVLGATENTTSCIATFWSSQTNSFDIECLFSEEKIVNGPENDFASSSMMLKKISDAD
jgi:WD40 repeat protein